MSGKLLFNIYMWEVFLWSITIGNWCFIQLSSAHVETWDMVFSYQILKKLKSLTSKAVCRSFPILESMSTYMEIVPFHHAQHVISFTLIIWLTLELTAVYISWPMTDKTSASLIPPKLHQTVHNCTRINLVH
jgi:hypothetical protein